MSPFTSGPLAPAPTVSSCTPNSGPAGVGTSTVVAGASFQSGCTVKFGNLFATCVSFTSSSSLSVTAPAQAAGAVNVVVINPDAQQSTGGTNAFTYNPGAASLTVTGINPPSGTANGGTTVTIDGSGFVNTPSVSQAKIGSTDCTGEAYVSPTRITAVTGAHIAGGPFNVVVTNPDGRVSSGGNNLFSYTAVQGGPRIGYGLLASDLGVASWWVARAKSFDHARIRLVENASRLNGIACNDVLVTFGPLAMSTQSISSIISTVISDGNSLGKQPWGDWNDESAVDWNAYLNEQGIVYAEANRRGVKIRGAPTGGAIDRALSAGTFVQMLSTCDGVSYQAQKLQQSPGALASQTALVVNTWKGFPNNNRPINVQLSANPPPNNTVTISAAQLINDISIVLGACTPTSISVFYTSGNAASIATLEAAYAQYVT